MASSTRTFTRAIPKSTAAPHTSALRAATRNSRQNAATRFFQSSRRQYSSSQKPLESNTAKYAAVTLVSALFGGGVYYTTSQQTASAVIPETLKKSSKAETPSTAAAPFTPTQADYQAVYDAVAKLLWEKDDYDDGSYAPVILRLAWHASGTYDAATGTGGSNGATMRFAPEAEHGANAGLVTAREFLEPIKAQFPWISYGDLWTLAGVCAIQEMQGPTVPWRPGRQDRDVAHCTPDGRLPDASQGQDHIRAIFGRMGFNDQEMVALSGAHALGRCHKDRSGFEGPWTFSPTVLTNDYYRLLMEEKWGWKNWSGPKQYEDATSHSLMMLPTDMALIKDEVFKGHVAQYAADNDKFFGDFSKVMVKLFELGVPFTQKDRFSFKSTLEAEAE